MQTWPKQMKKAAEQARKEGYALIGFAIKPDEGGIMKLDNQDMSREQFIAFVHQALTFYAQFTSDKELIVPAGEC